MHSQCHATLTTTHPQNRPLPKQKLCPIKQVMLGETKLSHHVYIVIRQVWGAKRPWTHLSLV